MSFNRPVTEAEIEDGLSLVARLIECYGDSYWPIFERLEKELLDRRNRRLNMADKISQYSNRSLKTVRKT
ncbi:MAG: hypothetical protein AAF292_11920 [Pseudomonadota bacterium]